MVERISQKIIGHCGLLPKTVEGSNQIELIYVIAAPFWGRGFAAEPASALRDYSIQELKLPRLVSLIDPDNTASERAAIKLGMKFDRETIRPGGRTMRVYAIEAGSSNIDT